MALIKFAVAMGAAKAPTALLLQPAVILRTALVIFMLPLAASNSARMGHAHPQQLNKLRQIHQRRQILQRRLNQVRQSPPIHHLQAVNVLLGVQAHAARVMANANPFPSASVYVRTISHAHHSAIVAQTLQLVV